jgi:hypothetical protein
MLIVTELELDDVTEILGALQQANEWLYPLHSDIEAGLLALGLLGEHELIAAYEPFSAESSEIVAVELRPNSRLIPCIETEPVPIAILFAS